MHFHEAKGEEERSPSLLELRHCRAVQRDNPASPWGSRAGLQQAGWLRKGYLVARKWG